MWIERDFSVNRQSQARLPIGILVGPRQVGKTHLLLHELGANLRVLSLDDLTTREQLQSDPALMLGDLDRPVLIDEAQYAPAVFPELKRRIDEHRLALVNDRNPKPLPEIWMTGSNMTLLDQEVRESLAGRASYHHLHGLSVHELKDRFRFEDVLFRGGWPELYRDRTLNPINYLNDIIRVFVEKDIIQASGILKTGAFLKALRLLAGRTAQTLVSSEVGAQAGVKGETLSDWVSLLSRNGVIHELPPYFSNRNKRIIKSPRIHFLDIGLATRLQGWQSSDPVLQGPAAGALFESLVYSELIKTRDHLGCAMQLYSYRTKEGEEVDFLMELENRSGPPMGIAIEVKLAVQGQVSPVWPKHIKRDFESLQHLWCVTLGGSPRVLKDGTQVFPITELASRILELAR
jgi:predicted AAA+ superfamily ATPase